MHSVSIDGKFLDEWPWNKLFIIIIIIINIIIIIIIIIIIQILQKRFYGTIFYWYILHRQKTCQLSQAVDWCVLFLCSEHY